VGPHATQAADASADGEWKPAGRAALLMTKNGELRIVKRDDGQTLPGVPELNPSWNVLRDALNRRQRGDARTVGMEEALRAARVIDRAMNSRVLGPKLIP
jgi:hypothetical protein